MLTDCIAALATPPGRSAVALIRASGSDVFEVASRVLRPFATSPLRSARLSRVIRPTTGQELDQALYVTFRGPASFTGEDSVEISTHGGLLVPTEVLAALLEAGARLSTAGEFTRRALLNGRIDLMQAEAIGDLIDATAPRQRQAALSQLDGGLSTRVQGLRQAILDLETLVCYEIDFPDEDDGPVPEPRIQSAIADVAGRLESLAATGAEGERLREGALVVIAGLPNVGKSSLFNALLGADRAIVTALPGTTRDAIEAPVTCNGFPVRLVDTAGIRETADLVEGLGVEVSRRYLRAANLIVFCIENGEVIGEPELAFLQTQQTPVLVVRTKADQRPGLGADDELCVSALTGVGLEKLRQEIARAAFTSLIDSGDVAPVLTRERHRIGVKRALVEVEAFGAARAGGVESAFAATHLRAAIVALEDLIGLVAPDDVLDRLFQTFCVGK